jgi:class 3 adenylate cyclase
VEIEQEFQCTLAILVVDTCGFSRSVRTIGVVHFLAVLEHLERLIVPLVETSNGKLLRREADNLFAVFPNVDAAVTAARAIVGHINVANGPLPAAEELFVSIGIGYGNLLSVGNDDLFGDEMNLASKLGEDLARESEILLTARAYKALDAQKLLCKEMHATISGFEITFYRLGENSTGTR